MAKITVSPNGTGGRKVEVNGVAIDDVMDVTMYVRYGDVDTVNITVLADEFTSAMSDITQH